MQELIRRAMSDPDGYVVVFEYVDKKGECTRRVVSPIRFHTSDRFLGLCLCREEPRMFQLDRCSNLKLEKAHMYTMPVPILVLAMAGYEPGAVPTQTAAIPTAAIPTRSASE